MKLADYKNCKIQNKHQHSVETAYYLKNITKIFEQAPSRFIYFWIFAWGPIREEGLCGGGLNNFSLAVGHMPFEIVLSASYF